MAKRRVGMVTGLIMDLLALATLVMLLVLFVIILVAVTNYMGWSTIRLEDLAKIPYIGYILIYGAFVYLALLVLGGIIVSIGSWSGRG